MHDQLRIKMLAYAQAIAAWASAFGIVKGENARFQLAQAIAAMRAGVTLREQYLLIVFHGGGNGQAIGKSQRGFKRLRQPQSHVVADFKAVDYHFDGVFLF